MDADELHQLYGLYDTEPIEAVLIGGPGHGKLMTLDSDRSSVLLPEPTPPVTLQALTEGLQTITDKLHVYDRAELRDSGLRVYRWKADRSPPWPRPEGPNESPPVADGWDRAAEPATWRHNKIMHAWELTTGEGRIVGLVSCRLVNLAINSSTEPLRNRLIQLYGSTPPPL